MEKLFKEYLALMKDLKKEAPDLYDRALDLIARVGAEFEETSKKYPYGWIDPFRTKRKP